MTTDGKTVMCGLDVFKTSEALGLPLDFILLNFDEKNRVVDWIDFINVALEHGWSMKTILTKIEYPIIDVYGKAHWIEIERRIRLAFEKGLINTGTPTMRKPS